ncbi:MAG: RND transporter [Roseateles depolymerans]|uniref:RND transporter n=1 Tax=Roseateles depolymerans TaxID=76731 RepID=A0A2W5FGR1_9BURK|nr:MAG: RND transporter [Roseateles depolymerans]
MWIVKLALSRPYTFAVLALLILIVGPLTALRTPTDIFPSINIPVVSVIWTYGGLSPQQMEQRITSSFERALTTTVGNIEHIESQSLNGVAVVKVFLQPGASVPQALSEIGAESASIVKLMPPGATAPLMLTYNASTVPILQLALSSKSLPEQTLYDLGNTAVRTQLATVRGASVPLPFGGKVRQVMVDIDQAALQAHGLAPLDVVNAVNAQSLILPSGTAKIGGLEYDVEMNASPTSIKALNDLPIRATPNGMVYVRDVAQVRDGYAPQLNIVRQDGGRAALLQVEKSGDASTLDIVAEVKALLPRIQAGLPSELHIQALADQSLFVKAAVQGVLRETLIAAALASLMILLFLGNWRATLIIATTIPLSILSSLTVLSALGETLNIMTLGGLALAVGILVDDATVTIENIERHLHLGTPLEQAILDGAGEIAVPAIVSTLCICIVFLPMFLLSGVARFLFVPLAEAVVFAMLASYVLSRTLVPTMAKFLLSHRGTAQGPGRFAMLQRWQAGFEAGFERLRAGYVGVLERALARRTRVVCGFLLFALLSLGLLGSQLGQDFFPGVDTGQIRLHLRARTGTRVESTAALVDQVERRVRQIIPAAQLDGMLDNIGLPVSGINLSYSTSGQIGEGDADILVTLKDGHAPSAGYVATLREQLPLAFPGVSFAFLPADIVSQILNFGAPAPIDVQIVGKDAEANREFARRLREQLATVPGLVDLRVQQPADAPQIQVEVDRTLAMQMGFTPREVASNLLVTLSGSAQTTPNFWLNPKNGVSYLMATQAPQYSVDSLQALDNIPVTGGSAGQSTRLGNLGTTHFGSAPAVVSHYNVQPVIDLYAAVQGRDLGSVARDVDRIVAQSRAELPRGAGVVVRGQVQTMQTSFAGLAQGMLFATLLVYLLMVVNFQSWLDPFVILTGLPLVMAGVAWMLFLTGTTISVPALTGAIMCVGIATANSILVVNAARDQLAAGVAPLQAALTAGATRFRPVLMTALAMIIGMLPMALGLGEGGEQNAPLGRAVLGGLTLGTTASLLFVPLIFAWLHGRRQRPTGVPQAATTVAPAP